MALGEQTTTDLTCLCRTLLYLLTPLPARERGLQLIVIQFDLRKADQLDPLWERKSDPNGI